MTDMEVLKLVVEKLHSRGARGIIGLRKKFAVRNECVHLRDRSWTTTSLGSWTLRNSLRP